MKSHQPLSYRIQQKLIRNTVVTKKMTGLVYGLWPDRTKNIRPFFTASYTTNERRPLLQKVLNGPINLLFVGSLSSNKQPLLSAKVCFELNKRGVASNLHIYGEGKERDTVMDFIERNRMENKIFLHGNQPQTVVKEAYRQCHFLIFLSKSEGWPKAVAEAMWWGCLPVTTAVSCVPEMIGYGERGDIVQDSVDDVCEVIENYQVNSRLYLEKCRKASQWAREFTLEMFASEVQKIVHGESPSDN